MEKEMIMKPFKQSPNTYDPLIEADNYLAEKWKIMPSKFKKEAN